MDLRKGSKATLLQQLVKYHTLKVADPTMWQFSAPLATDPQKPTSTRVKLTPSRYNTTYRGSQTFNYQRLDLQSVGNSVKIIRFDVVEGDTTHQHFPNLLKQLGVLFDESDLEATPLTRVGSSDSYTLTLTAKPDSLAWCGSTTIQVDPYPHISLYVNTPSFTWNQL